MPMLKLTKPVIDDRTPKATDKVYWDQGLRGFGLRLTLAGRKVFIVMYRTIDASFARMDVVDLEYASVGSRAGRKQFQSLALRHRDSLLVALSTFFPLRRANAAQFEIGTTIRRGVAGWSIHVPPEWVKNGEPADADLAEWLSERVDRSDRVIAQHYNLANGIEALRKMATCAMDGIRPVDEAKSSNQIADQRCGGAMDAATVQLHR